MGAVEQGIEYYLSKEDKLGKEQKNKTDSYFGNMFHNEYKINQIRHQWNKDTYSLEDDMILDFSFELTFEPKKLIIGIPIWDKVGNSITSFNSDYKCTKIFNGNYKVSGQFKTKCYFNPNQYGSVFVVVDGSEFIYRDRNEDFLVSNKERVFGYVTLPHEWIVNE
ncbi:hypothetical protein [Vibrio algarum]|uniref:Uncharacterized protein n=1 Tax=Vibrio algarum TaxID=3020714 RepID=A0ABT4YLR0_9VIBR|nr:hypothetical protein [Vibrio sp. KJ40-1]MDB1122433.1 hypothetical protein [Vibrio sp. KJ40-1]